MGTDPLARRVADGLAVGGIERLRICDSSVMPNEISANTNAPTIMIAEQGGRHHPGRGRDRQESRMNDIPFAPHP